MRRPNVIVDKRGGDSDDDDDDAFITKEEDLPPVQLETTMKAPVDEEQDGEHGTGDKTKNNINNKYNTSSQRNMHTQTCTTSSLIQQAPSMAITMHDLGV